MNDHPPGRTTGPRLHSFFRTAVCVAIAAGLFVSPSVAAEKIARLPLRADGPKSLDPVRGSTTYDNRCASMVYEPLLQYKYLVRPYALEPLLLESMPTRSEDGLTYSFRLKSGVRFHDDPCFPNGKGREITSRDVVYSWKRMADSDNLPKSWWLFEGSIVGFDAYRETQNAVATFDYDASVEGLRIIDERKFEVRLTKPYYRFLWTLAMFQTSVVPREAVEKYGTRFGRHPVGTGPFTLAESDWKANQGMTFIRNPNYHECYYPTEHMPADREEGLHLPAGKRIPFLDRVELTFFIQDQPMWLQFRAKKLDYSQVPAENFTAAFSPRTRKLRRSFRREDIRSYAVPLLDFIFRAFNMEDPVLGGYTKEKRALRQAIALALDWNEQNRLFYNSINVVYDGMIPPGLDGHPSNGEGPISYRTRDVDRARSLLAEAGYPGGKGLPALDYYTSTAANSKEQSEAVQRQLGEIGIKLRPRLLNFSSLIEAISNKKAPFFTFAWSSDYPDAENNLALFYGPNEAPGSNHSNYKNADYDALYEKLLVMEPSPERTALAEKMRDLVMADAPFCGSMARTRFYLAHSRLKNFKPTETFYDWVKYIDVEE